MHTSITYKGIQGVRIARREKENNQSQSALKKFQCDFKKLTLTYTMRMIKEGCLLKKKGVKMPFFRDLRGRGKATRNEQSPPRIKE